MTVTDEVTAALRAEEHEHPPCVALENYPIDGRVKIQKDNRVQTLTSRMGTGGMNVPLVLKIRSGCEGGGKGPLIQEDKSATLATNNDQTLFVPKAFGIDRAAFNQGRNAGYSFSVTEEVEPTMVAKGPGAVAVPVYCASKASFFTDAAEDVANTLVATDYKDPPLINGRDAEYTVRRLTPTECARLQGFPDWWCEDLGMEDPSLEDLRYWYDVFETHRKATGRRSKPKTIRQIRKWLADPHKDSAEYKMWGNGVALPCVYFVLSGIAYYAQIEG